jgi:hypothetical protein
MPQIFLVVRQDLAGLRKLVNRVCFSEARFFFEYFYLLANRMGVSDQETRLTQLHLFPAKTGLSAECKHGSHRCNAC